MLADRNQQWWSCLCTQLPVCLSWWQRALGTSPHCWHAGAPGSVAGAGEAAVIQPAAGGG